MAQDYIPTRQDEAATWMGVFAEGLLADPARYHILAQEAQQVAAVVAAYRLALARALDPQTRTSSAVLDKSQKMAQALYWVRQFAARIKADETIPAQDKIDIGVRPLNRHRRHWGAPRTAPAVMGADVSLAGHLLHVQDPQTGRRAKPAGVDALQLFVHIAEAPVMEPQSATFHNSYTRFPLRLRYGPDQRGKIATYFGRWASRRGQVGPWSAPTWLPIVA